MFNVELCLFFFCGEERRLMVFEKRVPKDIYGLERDEVTGEGKRLQNEKF